MTTTALAGIDTLAALPYRAAELFEDRPAQRYKSNGTWEDLSHRGLATIVDEVARGLVALGVRPGDRVAVLAETRAEWAQAAYGIAAAGAVVVPIYATNSAEECDWVLRDSGAVAVVCEDAEQVSKVDLVRPDLPDLVHVLTIEQVDGHVDLGALRAKGRDQNPSTREARAGEVDRDDPAVIIYTSGTTGRPKGCVLTHGNLLSCAQQAIDFDVIFPDDVVYLFLPLAHVFAQTTNIMATAIGCVTAYVSAGPAGIMADLAEVRPTYFPSVPRIFEKVHAAFAGAPRGDELNARVRAVFGGQVRIAISGAAPIAAEVLEFFHDAGVPIYEGYGLSESTSYGTLNTPDALRIGTIGPAMPFGEVRIADDGEILLRGPHIFAGYWNDPEATSATMTEDGWLRTGDLGEVDEDGFVRITGRKKEIIITAGGKNITPSEIENELRQSPLVSYAVMHGDRRPYPVALLTLDAEYVVPWARAQGIDAEPHQLADHPVVRAAVEQVVDDVNSRHAKVTQVKRFAILPADFSQESGELTPTLKMKRSVINSKYADVIDALYDRSSA